MLAAYFDTQEKRMLQHHLTRDSIAFSRYFHKNTKGDRYTVRPYHKVMAKTKRQVFEGKIKRLIVNIPPGYSKTQEWVVNLMAEGLAINPKALFMHLSYSDDLALWNSTQCRDIVESPEYQELFPMKIRHDVSAKKKWYTEHGGGVYATSAGGQVTGFRAGRIIEEAQTDEELIALEKQYAYLEKRLFRLQNKGEGQHSKARHIRRMIRKLNRAIDRRLNEICGDDLDNAVNAAIAETESTLKEIDARRIEGLPDFWGALIIDDPIKPEDAYSEVLRRRINNRFMNTFKSRLAMESETPMIIVMQRIHEEDPCGFLLTGGTGELWHHLLLPVEIPEGNIKDWYPRQYTHGIPIDPELPPGPLWPKKHSQEKIEEMRKADPYTTASQYDQLPTSIKALIFKREFWRFYNAVPENVLIKRIYVDTAQKTADHNDYTVMQCWGYVPGKGIYLLDLYREKLETPQLEDALLAFWGKHKYQKWVNPIGAQIIKVEDKSSGSGLIQTVQQKHTIPIEGIPRHRDKVMRAMDGVSQISAGNVYLPIDAPWLHDFLEECRKFTPMMTHKHDDQIDPMLDAIEDMLIEQVNIYEGL
jgi:predicted phage terminase large subunit-like protein